jgi:hypothetical protein
VCARPRATRVTQALVYLLLPVSSDSTSCHLSVESLQSMPSRPTDGLCSHPVAMPLPLPFIVPPRAPPLGTGLTTCSFFESWLSVTD